MKPGSHNSNNSNDKAKDFKGTLNKLLSYLKIYRKTILIVILFSIASACFSIIGPKIMGNVTTIIFEGLFKKINGTGSIDFTKIKNLLFLLFGLYFASFIFSVVQTFLMTNVTQKVSYDLRKKISNKINKLPMNYFDKKKDGDILSVVTNDVDTLSQNLNQSMTQVISSITTLIGVLVMMLSISLELTIVSILLLPISFVFVGLIIGKSQKHFVLNQEYLGNLNGHIEETYGGHNIIRAFNAEDESKEKFDELNDSMYESSWKSQFLSGMIMPIMTFIGNIGYVIVSIYGSYLTIKGKMKVGDILSFTQYIRSFNQPIGQIAQIASLLQTSIAASERVFNFLEEEEEIETNNDFKFNKLKGNITFDNVSFGYNSDKLVINNFSLKVKPGEKIAIVGPTGAGKTTLVKLLMRFYDVNDGSIKIDNTNIKDIKRSELRSLFGMVLQDTWLFSGSIKENIKYGKLNANDEEVINASKSAMVHHFVKTLPDSYDMILNEDTNNISSGQKQLLTIARVILSDPKILILDEATSNVDTRTELLIQSAMDNLMENRTSFIIAHRLSTIKNADKILVINNGDIVEQGSHEELIKLNGFYTNLYNSQFEEAEI